MSVRQRRIPLLPNSSINHEHQQKRRLQIEQIWQGKQEYEPNKTRIFLGDWNAGKEAKELARPELRCPQGFVR